MTTTVSKWRIWCDSENQWAETWSPGEPTTCPNNNAHVIDQSKTTIIEAVTESFPMSEVGGKIWVHSSPKPVLPDKQIYVQWVGAGDDMDNHVLGQGPIMHLEMTPGNQFVTADAKFDQTFGEVYVHRGYCRWSNAGPGDNISALIVAEPSRLQQVANLDLVVDGNGYVKYAPGGPGTGTHGFAATPHLLSRSFSHDGEWNYDAANGLTPNLTNTGDWRISTSEQPVHRFISRVPLYGTCNDYFTFDSNDTFKLPPGYFLRILAENVSNTTWRASVMMQIFRERTYQP
jgi:hypothetical protein